MQTDVVIVGGGVAGLSAASYLARAGVQVTLFEKAAHLGGRATSQEYSGYTFNRGGHALYVGGAATAVLRELGVSYQAHSPRHVQAMRQDQFFAYPADISTIFNTTLFNLAERMELLRLFARLATLKARQVQHLSVEAWIASHIKRPRVRQFMRATAHTLLYCVTLDRVSMEPFITQLQLSLKKPVLYLDGGWQTLVDGLRHAAAQAGAQIISGTRVEAVLRNEERQAAGVRLVDERVIPARGVLLATEPGDVRKLVDDPALWDTIAGLVPLQVACLDVALRRLPRLDRPVVLDMEQPRFSSAQSLFARVAPSSGALIHTVRYFDATVPGDAREHERDLEALLDVEQPGWRAEVVKRVFLPRMDVMGALPCAESGGFAGRPGPRVAHIPGLYLAGDWIGPEGYLVDASLASARQAAQLLLREIPARSRLTRVETGTAA